MLNKSILVCIGLIIGVVLSELIIRVLGMAPELVPISIGRFQFSSNPLIGYEPRPNFEYDKPEELWYFEFSGRSNSLGFRDREHEVKKSAGVHRIIVIGDSITMGLSVPHVGDVYTSVLEDKLLATGARVEVLNFGVSGYNTQQEVATLEEKGLKFAPDTVILQYCLNDRYGDNGNIPALLRELEESSGAYDLNLASPYLRHSALYRFMVFRAFPVITSKWIDRRTKSMDELLRDSVDRSFDKLRRLSDKHNFDVLIALFPFPPPEAESIPHPDLTAIPRLAEENGFNYLDLSRVFERCATQGHVLADEGHPNELGHRCAGEALFNLLFPLMMQTS